MPLDLLAPLIGTSDTSLPHTNNMCIQLVDCFYSTKYPLNRRIFWHLQKKIIYLNLWCVFVLKVTIWNIYNLLFNKKYKLCWVRSDCKKLCIKKHTILFYVFSEEKFCKHSLILKGISTKKLQNKPWYYYISIILGFTRKSPRIWQEWNKFIYVFLKQNWDNFIKLCLKKLVYYY